MASQSSALPLQCGRFFPDGSKQLLERLAAHEQWQRYVADEPARLRSPVKVRATGAPRGA
jgi:hypothetical protein